MNTTAGETTTIVDMYLSHMPLGQICHHLNEQDPDRETQWVRPTVKRLIERCAKGIKEGELLTPQVRSLLKTMLSQPSATKPSVHLLYGKLTCDCDQSLMIVQTNRKKYSCTTCKSSIAKVDVEQIVLDNLRSETIPPITQDKLPASNNISHRSSHESCSPDPSIPPPTEGVPAIQEQQYHCSSAIALDDFSKQYPLDIATLDFTEMKLLIEIRVSSITYIPARSEIVVRKFPLSQRF